MQDEPTQGEQRNLLRLIFDNVLFELIYFAKRHFSVDCYVKVPLVECHMNYRDECKVNKTMEMISIVSVHCRCWFHLVKQL